MNVRHVLLTGLAAASLCGCRGSGRSALLEEDSPPADPRSPRQVVTLTGDHSPPEPIAIPGPSALTGSGDGPEGPATSGPAPAPTGDSPVVVDAKVGDVNGRPIFASEVLDEGLAALLTQDARREGVTEQAWAANAQKLIAGAVSRIVEDELIEAEARASLEPEQKQGLRYWLKERREEARRKAQGSRVVLEQQLRDQGTSVEDWERDLARDELIKLQVRQQVWDRAMVTWPDIKFHYEVNYKQFNPEPTARLRLIRVLTASEEAVTAVQSALDRGEAFETVAAMDLNTFNRAGAGVETRALSGEYADTQLFGAAELNDAAHALKPGEWTPQPVKTGDFSVWVKLESIDTLRRPLSDPGVQREITAVVGNRKRQEVYQRYLNRLMEGAHFTGFEEMTGRLYEIARERYWTTRG